MHEVKFISGQSHCSQISWLHIYDYAIFAALRYDALSGFRILKL